jgi:hypothetical protein
VICGFLGREAVLGAPARVIKNNIKVSPEVRHKYTDVNGQPREHFPVEVKIALFVKPALKV